MYVLRIFVTLTLASSNLLLVDAAEGLNFFDFLMSSSNLDNQKISFSPDDGKKFRRSFESKYGPRGKLLIESMGQGTPTYISTTESTDKTTGKSKQILKIKKRIVKKSTTLTAVTVATSTMLPSVNEVSTSPTTTFRLTSRKASSTFARPKIQ